MTEYQFENLCMEIEEKAAAFSSIIGEVLKPLKHSINFDISEVIKDESVFAFELKSIHDALPLTIVFWFNPVRLTILLDKHEISDDYLNTEKDIKDLIAFLKLVLSFEIVEVLYKNNKGVLKRKILKYPVIEASGIPKIIEDTVISKFSWFNGLTKSSKTYKAWL